MPKNTNGVLKQVSEALRGVLVSDQRASLNRDGGRLWLSIDNTKTLRGIEVEACPGCEECRAEGVRHLRFTPYELIPRADA